MSETKLSGGAATKQSLTKAAGAAPTDPDDEVTLIRGRKSSTTSETSGLNKAGPGAQLNAGSEEHGEVDADATSRTTDGTSNTACGVLDWRGQFHKRPLTLSVGALSIGLMSGYGFARIVKGNTKQFRSPGKPKGAGPYRLTSGSGKKRKRGKEEASPHKGLIEKIQATQVYSHLQSKVAAMGERLIDQLVEAGHNVVLPAVTGKIRELIDDNQSG